MYPGTLYMASTCSNQDCDRTENLYRHVSPQAACALVSVTLCKAHLNVLHMNRALSKYDIHLFMLSDVKYSSSFTHLSIRYILQM